MNGTERTSNPIPSGAVVVAVDGSETADRAVAWAAKYAASEDQPLVIAHAFDAIGRPEAMGVHHVDGGAMYAQLSENLRIGGEELVKAAIDKVGASYPSLSATSVVEDSDPRQMLLRLGEDASLLVMGSRGRGTFRSLVLGSVTAAVAGRVGCPVVVIPQSGDGAEATSRSTV